MDSPRKEALQFALAIADLSAGTMTGHSPMEATQVILAVAAELERWLDGHQVIQGRVEVSENEF